MKLSLCLSFAVLCNLLAGGHTSMTAAEIDTALARQYFTEARAICEQDGGLLWGIDLSGPMLFVTRSHEVVANQNDSKGTLAGDHGLFYGALPMDVNIANTAVRWGGTDWMMLVWPLPADEVQRKCLIAHELWHRIQNQAGFPASDPSNSHLDARDGRVWMRMEWRALAMALQSTGAERKRAVEDAIVFRGARREIFHDAFKKESALELNEGLAEYTGMHIGCAGPEERLQYTLAKLTSAPRAKTFVRSFAYATGPAYGLLCEQVAPAWLKQLRKVREMSAVTQSLYKISLKGNIGREAKQRAAAYGYDSVAADEGRLQNIRRERDAANQKRFIDDPILTIGLHQMNMSFDPNTSQAFDTIGTVYPTIRITDAWGVLDVTSGGALMDKSYGSIRVSAPKETTGTSLRGEGWTLDLKPSWHLVQGKRAGDYILEEMK